MTNLEQVPSVISYDPPLNRERQWSSDIADDSTVMINLKLDLDTQGTLYDELKLTLQVLEGIGGLAFDHIKKIGVSGQAEP